MLYDRLACSIRDSQEMLSRYAPCVARGYPGLWCRIINYVCNTAKSMSTHRGPAEWADLQGPFCVPAQCLNNIASCGGDVAIIALLESLRSCIPVAFSCFTWRAKPLFALGWHLSEGSALPPATAPTTAARWQGRLLLVAGHLPHGRQLRTTC